MKYLVDANVLSEPTKPVPDASVIGWLRRHERDLVVSPIILGELEYGILILPAGRRRARLEQWFSTGVPRLQVLDFDTAVAGTWAALLARLKKKGRAMPIKDSLIAATALTHKLTVATRNVVDFRTAGIPVENPFQNSTRA
ncbi:MAG: type II toxin-antitoxin system VapC family toxin [Chthoniobacterales bacterium]